MRTASRKNGYRDNKPYSIQYYPITLQNLINVEQELIPEIN